MLTDALIRKLPDSDVDRLIPAGNRTGLYLRARASGRRTWVIRRRIGGAWRIETLGDWPQVTALNARQRATTSTPKKARPLSFGDAAETFYLEAILPKYRNSPGETKAYLTRDCAAICGRRLDAVTRADIAKIIRTKAVDAPNAAAKLLAVVKKFTAWAQLGELIEDDPCIGLTGKRLGIPSPRPRERKLSDAELVALWQIEDEPYGSLLRFAFLTGSRIGEAMQFDASQVEGDVWRIPMTKNGRPHSVPLSPTAAALAKAGWPARGYQALFSFCVARGITWRPHDLRRTAATRMREAGVASDVIEAVLNHAPPRLQRTYQLPNMLPVMRDALAKLDEAVGVVVSNLPLDR